MGAWLKKAIGASFVVVAGCTPLRSSDDTAATVFGTSSTDPTTGTITDPAWACLNPMMATPAPNQGPPDGGRVDYVVAIVDFDSQPLSPTPVQGLNITVCDSSSCDPPVQGWTATNPMGEPPFVYDLNLPYGLANAYLKLTAPNYAEMDYYFSGPLIGPPEGGYIIQGLTIPLLTLATRDGIYQELGATTPADPTRGVLAVRTLNCLRDKSGPIPQGTRAAGVQLQALGTPPPSPAIAWTLSFSNIATANKLETDSRGVAGYINVSPTSMDVQGLAPVGTNGPTPYGALTIRILPGVITLAEIRDGLDVWGQ